MRLLKAIPLSLFALSLLAPGAGALATGRNAHTTTLLPDGNILVLGGVIGSANTPTATGEIYFASAAAFGVGPTLPAARSSHTATLMGDGRVLVAGGFNSGTPLNTAYTYNPLTKSWSGAITMTSARGAHTATLINKGPLSGNVIICGGQALTAMTTAGGITNSCEVFFSTASGGVGAFGAMQPMTSARMGHTASAIVNGRVFVSGGLLWDSVNSTFTYLTTNEIYDPQTNRWDPKAPLLQGRTGHTAVVMNNGNIFISGGYNGTNRIDSPEEAWYTTPAGVLANQDPGNRGYLDGPEIFDSNGGRVTVTGTSYSVAPYRNANQAAVLMPDGTIHLHGGYGNIVPTYFTQSPLINPGSQIHTTKTNITTATIDGSSNISLELGFKLSRAVSGRLVNSNIYLSLPADSLSPAITVDNATIYPQRSTSAVDGMPVGRDIGGNYVGGDFFGDVSLASSGRVVFAPQEAAAEDADVTTLNFVFAGPLAAGASVSGTGSMTVPISFPVSKAFTGGVISGSMTILSGTVSDNSGRYTLTLTGGVANTFTSGSVTYDSLLDQSMATASVTFTGLVGTITNSTTTSFNSPVSTGPSGAAMSAASVRALYTSTVVDVSGQTYQMDVSTLVVREMIFSDNLSYTPSTTGDGSWTFGDPLFPVFNQSAVVTPAADVVILGGRNCEPDPANDCLRTSKKFTSTGRYSAYIMTSAGKWTDSGALNTKRAFHTSTLMPDDSILTCGGSDGTNTLASCEVMDPVTKLWSYTGSMNYPRSGHTATLLPNGRVLVAGGVTSVSTQAAYAAEIYYPETHRWVLTSSMTYARANHTATLLPDGNVLVAAGSTANAYSNTAEIYITTGAVWQPTTGNLSVGRAHHTATIMKSGNVLIAGGSNGGGTDGSDTLNSVELYNYATRTWSTLPSMNTRRTAHSATLLMDGRVLVTGGSDGSGPLGTAEVFDGSSWRYTTQVAGGNNMLTKRAHHRATLLPNGNVLLTGGEIAGGAVSVSEGYNVNFSTWQDQGTTSNRADHTTVLTSSGMLVAIGGWSGSQYLNTTETRYFTYSPDTNGYDPKQFRRPVISTGTLFFDRGQNATLISNASNFHGITEASGGGAGSANSSFHNPRVYIQSMDNPSGFLTDLTTSLYTLYGGQNSNWENTLSSITVIAPSNPGELPYGWYTMRVDTNGQFSNGHAVQVTIPRPTGYVSNITGTVNGTSSITWGWDQGTVFSADSYSLYSSSDNAFIAAVPLGVSGSGSYTQSGLAPNTAAGVLVGGYNLGGGGPLAQSATYYTLAAAPASLAVKDASFENASLTWDSSGNSADTAYELSLSPDNFSDPALTLTPIPFSVTYTSTFAVVSQLSPNQMYYFRVRAINGAGLATAYSNTASTITVGNINNFTGTAVSSSAINWSWDASEGATYYNIYSVASGTDTASRISTTSANFYTQQGLLANRQYSLAASAVKTTVDGPISGPMGYSDGSIYTLTVSPLPGVPNAFTNISTGSLTANWITNENSTWTVYAVAFSADSGFSGASTTTTMGSSANFTGLSPNVRYYARVTAYNGNNIPSAPLDLGYKYTKARAPVSVTPASISLSGVSLVWNGGDNSASTIYEVRGSTTQDFSGAVTKYKPFSSLYTGATLDISGLLTSTTYYFDVAACNGDGVLLGCTGTGVSARIPSVPVVFTLPGPDGAPGGSVGGTADPLNDVLISGDLPNGRHVELSIPAGTFTSAVSVAISSSITNACDYLAGGTTPIEVAIYSQNKTQPARPVTLTLGFGNDTTGVIADITSHHSTMVMARYNPVSGQCLPLETTIDTGHRTITAALNHFSVFQLIIRTASSDLNHLLVYPNPFYANRGHGFVTIANMPASAKVRIYTLSGEKIWEGTAGTTGILTWRGVNNSGRLVASGVYLAVIDSSAGKKIIKLAVER